MPNATRELLDLADLEMDQDETDGTTAADPQEIDLADLEMEVE
jgi:hypothetical protein